MTNYDIIKKFLQHGKRTGNTVYIITSSHTYEIYYDVYDKKWEIIKSSRKNKTPNRLSRKKNENSIGFSLAKDTKLEKIIGKKIKGKVELVSTSKGPNVIEYNFLMETQRKSAVNALGKTPLPNNVVRTIVNMTFPKQNAAVTLKKLSPKK